MKKAIILTAAMMMTFMTASCGSSDETVTKSGKVELPGSSTTEVTSAADITTAEESSETTESTTATTESTTTAKETTTATTTTTKKATTTTAATTTKKVTTTTTAATKTTTKTTTAAPKPAAAYSDQDAVIIYKGVTLAIDSDMASASAALGQPDSKQENPNCLSGTKGTTYMYGATMINVYESGGKEYIESVLADGDKNASTPKGVAVGGSASDIAKAYGSGGNATDFMTEYKGSRTSMMFYTEGGSVTGIFITKVY